MRLRLRTRLLLAVLIYLLLLSGVGVMGVYAAQVSLSGMHTAVEHHVRELSIVGDVAAEVNLVQSTLLLQGLSRSADEEQHYEAEVNQREARVNALVEELLQVQEQFDDEGDIHAIEDFQRAWDEFVVIQNEQFLPLSRERRAEQAFALAQANEPLGLSFGVVRTSLDEIRRALPSEATERLQRIEQEFAANRNLLLATLVMTGAVGVGLGLNQATRLARAIEALSRGAERVARGNLGGEVLVETGDELESLAESFNDMTRNLEQVSEERTQAERVKNEFVSMVSHELRTPLNGIIGMTGLLLRQPLGAGQRECAEAVRRSGDALLAIINDILDFGKIEAGRFELESGPVDLRGVVEDVTTLLAETAQRKGLEIACFVEPSIPHDLGGDANRLRQVLLNLVGNAIKFTDAGQVLVRAAVDSAAADGVLVRFEVADTGIGIAETARADLFQAFSQADASRTGRYAGTGLGLAISKRLTELMGGDIGFESTPGQGSTFWATVRFTRRAPRPVPPAPGPPPELRGRPVLVVDDNAATRELFEQQMAAWQIDAEGVGDAACGLQRLKAGLAAGAPFAVALLKHKLPELDGFALARQIRSDPTLDRTALLLLTSMGESVTGEELAAAGVAASLDQPIRRARFLEVLSRILSGAQAADLAMLAAPHAEGGAHSAATTPRVLLVDDIQINQQVAAGVMRGLGCDVDFAANGHEALAAIDRSLATRPYAAVLMDCEMPDLDGFETTAEIRRREAGGRSTPIIAVTASVMRGDRERCLAAGMDDYIAKPVRFETMEAILRRWLPALPPVDAAEPEPAGSSTAAIDRVALAELAHQLDRSETGDGGALADMIAQFRVETMAQVRALREAADRRDAPALRRAAHSIRGPAALFGARDVETLSTELERLGRADTTLGAEQVIDALQAAVRRASTALESVRPAARNTT